jgi:Domain of unknown function (DUF4399)
MLIRYLTVMCLLLIAACGQEAAEEAQALPTPSATAAQPAPAPAPAPPARRAAPAGAVVYFIEPAGGAVVSGPVRIVFGLRGAGIAPAGVEREGAGHHHLLVDADLPADLGLPIPNDDRHRHFGGGQTETSIELAPGSHTLQLLLADERHIPHDPPIMSERITIEVR